MNSPKKKTCASCKGMFMSLNKLIKTDNTKKPKWIEEHDYVNDFIENTPVEKYRQQNTSVKITLNVGKSKYNNFVLYWGSKSNNNPMIINNAKKAYA